MNAPIRPVIIVVIAFLLAVCVFGLHFACDSAGLRIFIQEDGRTEELKQFRRSFFCHFEAKDHVVRNVIAQQCSLSEALAKWKDLDREWLQEVGRNWPNSYPGMAGVNHQIASDADFCFQRFIWRVEGLLGDRPEEAAAVLGRLEKEYQQLRRHPAGGLNCHGDAAPFAR